MSPDSRTHFQSIGRDLRLPPGFCVISAAEIMRKPHWQTDDLHVSCAARKTVAVASVLQPGMSWSIQWSGVWPAKVGGWVWKLEGHKDGPSNKTKEVKNWNGIQLSFLIYPPNCVVLSQPDGSAEASSSGETENCQERRPNWNLVRTRGPENRSFAIWPSELWNESKGMQLRSARSRNILSSCCIFTWFYVEHRTQRCPCCPLAEERDAIIKPPPLFTVEHRISDV